MNNIGNFFSSIVNSATEAYYQGRYNLGIMHIGFCTSSAKDLAVPVGLTSAGVISSVYFAARAYNAKSKCAQVGYAALSLWSAGATIYVGYTGANDFLKAGCHVIYKAFGGSIPSYSTCNQFIGRATIMVMNPNCHS